MRINKIFSFPSFNFFCFPLVISFIKRTCEIFNNALSPSCFIILFSLFIFFIFCKLSLCAHEKVKFSMTLQWNQKYKTSSMCCHIKDHWSHKDEIKFVHPSKVGQIVLVVSPRNTIKIISLKCIFRYSRYT